MPKPIKIDIVGLGKMGLIRAKTVRENDETVLALATDPKPPINGLEGVRVLPDYEAVLESGVDAAFGDAREL